MEWIMLILAGASEITWAVSMKESQGFTKAGPTVITIIFYILSAVFLSVAMKKLPLGTAYALWTGMGIVGTTLCGVFIFKEMLSPLQIVWMSMIVAGIACLKLFAR